MKYSLALEGGGMKGSYHVGVLKALKDMDIKVEAVSGTSIGAINGAYYIQEGYEKLYEYWENIEPGLLIPEDYKALAKLLEKNYKDYKDVMKELSHIIKQGGIELDAFKKSLYTLIDEDKIRNSDLDFGLVTFSLTDFKPVEVMIKDIPDGKLIEYILASSYLPGFKREKLDGKSFLDGAFYDNLPINLLLENGYNNIIAIELLGMGLRKKVKEKDANVIYITPSDDIGRVLNFDKDVFDNNIKMGYYDARRVFENFYGKWYYISELWSSRKAFEFINNISYSHIEGLANILDIKLIPHKRCLFEKIIPKIIDLADIKKEADYNIIMLSLLEYVGKYLGVDRYNILTMDEFIVVIKEKLLEEFDEELIDWNESVVKLLKTTKLYRHTFKEKLIVGCVQLFIMGKSNI